jgi:hypothetical protein
MIISSDAKYLIRLYLSKNFTKDDKQIEGVDTSDFKSVLLGIKRTLVGKDPILERARLLCSISMYNDSVDVDLYDILSEIIANSTNGNIGISGSD